MGGFYVPSTRSPSITWSNNPMYWLLLPSPLFRFAEVAMLRTTDWLEIEGKMKTEMLLPGTMYGAYPTIKITNLGYGFDSVASEVSVKVGAQVSTSGRAYLVHDHHHDHDQDDDDRSFPCELEIGWMETELGEFYSRDAGVHDEVKEANLNY